MIDDLPSLKAATVALCCRRASKKHTCAPNSLSAARPDRYTTILNSLRARQTRPDTGRRLIYRERLGARPNTRRILMILPTLPRLDAERPTLRHPRWSIRPSHRPYIYPSHIEEQWYRLRKNKKSRDYRSDDGLKRNPMIYKSLFNFRKAVDLALSRSHQYAISQNPI